MKVLSFIDELIKDLNTLSVTKGYSYVIFSYMLKEASKEKLTLVQSYYEEIEDGVTCCAEAIQYLRTS